MTLGIVVVAYKCRELLIECLGSIELHTPALLESVVVIDNASSDGTPAAVRARWPQIRLVENQRNEGFAAAANRGMTLLQDCSVICLLNPDAVMLDPAVLDAAAYLEAHDEVGVLGCRVLNANGTIQSSARSFPHHLNALFNRHSLATKFLPANRWSRKYLMTDWAHDAIRPVDWVSGAYMLIHRRALEAAGTFDEAFFFSIEDVDFCRRVRDAGLEVVYFPGASILHRIGGSSRNAVYRAMTAHHRGMWRYYRKHLRGNRAVDVATFVGILARLGLHAVSYAIRTARNRIIGRANP